MKSMLMPTIQQWLSEYGDSHKNETNKAIHWICVPAIFFSIIGFFYEIKLPFFIEGIQLNLAIILAVLVIAYYFSLSRTLWIGMLFFIVGCLLICHFVEVSGFIRLWLFCLAVFVLAWIAQFYGHKVEGKKPSFLKDLQFLMIGPAWLMSFIYKKIGLPI
ncbi:MAG: Mpo1-like protein [Ferruginibacter sp.]